MKAAGRHAIALPSAKMAEWFYKATSTKLDHVGTRMLINKGFLCRSAYSNGGKFIANVREVAPSDLIRIYFRGGNAKFLHVGDYRVVTPEERGMTAMFGGLVPETRALYFVEDDALVKKWDPKGEYQPDPTLKKLTGFVIEQVASTPPQKVQLAKFERETATLVAHQPKAEGAQKSA
jgi:hypothetical protein